MKKYIKKFAPALLFTLTLIFAPAAFLSCGSSSDSKTAGTGGADDTKSTTISGPTEGGSAAASGTQGASVSQNTSSSLRNLTSGSLNVLSQKVPQYKGPLVGEDARFNNIHVAQLKIGKSSAMALKVGMEKARAKAAASPSSAPVNIGTLPPVNCVDGGTVTISGTFGDNTDQTNTNFEFSMLFDQCREYDAQTNGTIIEKGSLTATGGGNFTMTMSNFTTQLYTENYGTLFARYTADMTVTFRDFIFGINDGMSFTFTASGREEYTESGKTYSMMFNNLSFASTFKLGTGNTAGEITMSGSDTANGGFSETWTNDVGSTEGVSITFTDFANAWSLGGGYGRISSGRTAPFDLGEWSQWSIDGTLTTGFTPSDLGDCFGGTFVFETTTPVHFDKTLGYNNAGRVVINGSTVIEFNPASCTTPGCVVVTVGDGTPATYSSIEELERVCPIEDFEEDTL